MTSYTTDVRNKPAKLIKIFSGGGILFAPHREPTGYAPTYEGSAPPS